MHDCDVAMAVAEVGAAVVRRSFGTTLQHLEKGAGDFATNVDIEAEHAMLAVLHRERPADAVLGEESGRSGAHSGGRTWLLDPLCGTRNYAVRMHVAAVNVALQSGGRCLAAAVADPFNHELFWTDGVAAWARVDGQDTPLTPDGWSQLVDLNFDPPFPNAPAFTAVTLAADAASPPASGHGWSRPRWHSLGSPRGSARPISRTGTCARACTSRPASPSAKRPAARSLTCAGMGGDVGPPGLLRRRMPRSMPRSCRW